MDNNELLDNLKLIVGDTQVRTGEPMNIHTTFRIGGCADYYVQPSSIEELQSLIQFLNKSDIEYCVIGNGSNLLVSDKGIRGVVIQLSDTFDEVEYIDDVTVKVMSGMMLSRLGNKLADKGLAGFEFATGIPGSVGGAVRMNAGAHGSEMKDIVKNITYMTRDGNIQIISNEEAKFEYRNSIFSQNDYIILEAEIQLRKGNPEEIRSKMDEYATYRKEKQPIEYPSAGSTFKRGNDFITAKLIDECGLKGYQIGGAQVSEKHAGFIINKGSATAEDVKKLMKYVEEQVYNKFGKKIEAEIEII